MVFKGGAPRAEFAVSVGDVRTTRQGFLQPRGYKEPGGGRHVTEQQIPHRLGGVGRWGGGDTCTRAPTNTPLARVKPATQLTGQQERDQKMEERERGDDVTGLNFVGIYIPNLF